MTRAMLRPAAATARWALRAYAASTLLTLLAGALAVSAVLPLSSLGGTRAARLALAAPPDGDLGIAWLDRTATAATLQARGIATIGGIVFGLALAALAVAALTILAFAVQRAAARRTEMVVRRSMGATRAQLRLGGLLEGLMLAAAVVVVALPVGLACASWALAAWPGGVRPGAGPLPAGAVLVLAAAIVGGASLAALVIPRTPRPAAGGASALDLAVPALQLAISFAMLLAAAQLSRRAGRLLDQARAAGRGGGEIFQLDLPRPVSERGARYASLIERLHRGHAYDVVSLTSPGALLGLGTVDVVITDCGMCSLGGMYTPLRPVPATIHAVSPDTFQAIGVRLRQGRLLGAADGPAAARVAVINRTLAERQFERRGAVGRKIHVGRGDGEDSGWYTVVGVVEDRPVSGFGADYTPPYTVYLSATQFPPRAAELLLRPAAADGGGAEREIRSVLGGSALVVGRTTESASLAAAAAPVRWFERLARLGGALVLVIAALGTFAVMQLWVTALAPELAVRRAVGARRRHIVGYVMARAAAVAAVGVVTGMLLSELSADPLAALLGGLPLWEVALVPRVAAVLVGAALLGAFIPAWRAARADPAGLGARLDG